MGKKKEKEKKPNSTKNNRSFYMTIILCMIIFMASIAYLIISFNRLISQHDEHLSSEICTLLTEKMNNSLRFMTDSAKDISEVLSAQDFKDLGDIYRKLSSDKRSNYVGIGFIDEEGLLYATPAERYEFSKWNLLSAATYDQDITISAPYRSTTTGQPVITLFTSLRYAGGRQGTMFITYRLSDLQDIVNTESLTDEIEIWLMDAESANMIQCVGTAHYAIGSWSNAYLSMQDINEEYKEAYDEWHKSMVKGTKNAALNYKIGKINYSQFCAAIDNMPGWYVVVRIPGNALSATMNTFRNYVLIFLALLLTVVILLIINMYARNRKENRKLEQLSIHDPLTGLLNRRAFDYAAQQQVNSGEPSVFIFFDIDYFKQVNDLFGHDSGDKILKTFSEILKSNFRGTDLISRYGGDEYVVLAKTDSVPAISRTLAAIRDEFHSVKSSDFSSTITDHTFTFSAGAAISPADSSEFEDLKKCADEALYKVKEFNRDGYLWYDEAVKPDYV